MAGGDSPFLGREAAILRLTALADAAARGVPEVLLVEGAAGIGKTRLIRELQARIGPTADVLVGGAVSIGGDDLAFGPITAALRRIDLPWPPHDAPDDASGRLRVLEALLETLGELGAQRPTLLVLEDLHWADPSTRSAVDHLARNLTDERVALVCTYRDDELHRGHPWRSAIGELLRLDRVDSLHLEPLGRDHSDRLVAHLCGPGASARDREEIFRRGQGIPFFTEELARALGRGETGLPATLGAVLERQVERLPDDVVRVLRVAAVVGDGMAPDLLADLAGIEPNLAEDALRAAVDAGFVVRTDEGLAFRHALLREAVESTLLPSERRSLHAKVATRFESTDDVSERRLAEIARHWYLAGDHVRAHAAALRAADRATAEHDPLAALVQLDLALDTWGAGTDTAQDAASHVALLIRAAETAHDAGDPHRGVSLARRAVEIARAAGLTESRVLALTTLASAHAGNLDYDDAWRTQQDAVASVEDGTRPEVRSYVYSNAASLAVVASEWRTARSMARLAVEAATVADRPVDHARAVGAAGVAAIAVGRIAEGIALLEEAERLARTVRQHRIAHVARTNHVEVLYHLGHFDRCVELGVDAIADARRAGLGRTLSPAIAGLTALAALQLGQLDVARTSITGQMADPIGLGGIVLDLARARLAIVAGDVRTAVEALERAAARPGDGLRLFAADWAAVRLEVAAVEDDPVPGALRAAEVMALAETLTLVSSGWWTVSRAEALRALRPSDDPAVADVVESMRATVETATAPIEASGGASRTLAPWRDLADAFVDGGVAGPATEELERRLLDARLDAEVSWARLAGAATDLARGDRDHAATTIQALLVGDASSATHVVRELAADLARRGRLLRIAVAQPDASTAHALTARELDVLRLVAEGLTNRELAERLYISPKTASVHVSNLMRKLDVSDRRAAAAVARRLGLVAE